MSEKFSNERQSAPTGAQDSASEQERDRPLGDASCCASDSSGEDDPFPLTSSQHAAYAEWCRRDQARKTARNDAQYTVTDDKTGDFVTFRVRGGQLLVEGFPGFIDFACEQLAEFRGGESLDNSVSVERSQIYRRMGDMDAKMVASFDWQKLVHPICVVEARNLQMRSLGHVNGCKHADLDALPTPTPSLVP